MASVVTLAKAAVVSGIIRSITGTDPQIVDRGGEGVSIEFSEDQKRILREKLLSIVEARPGEIKMDLPGLIGPVLIKKLWWVIAAPLALGFFAGYILKSRDGG